jgi:uncharacterized protein (TIGR03437 family)
MRTLLRQLSKAILAALTIYSVYAQSAGMTSVQITASDRQAVFLVDGTPVTGSGTFLWPLQSKHTIAIQDLEQNLNSEGTVLRFGSWSSSDGLLNAQTTSVIVITADGAPRSYLATFTRMHRLTLNFHDTIRSATGEVLGWWPGWVKVNGECLIASGSKLIEDGRQVILQASPNPGWAFMSWNANQSTGGSYLTSFTMTRPVTLYPAFAPAARIFIRTVPERLQVLVNRTLFQTTSKEDICLDGGAPYAGIPQYPPPSNPQLPNSGYASCPGYRICAGAVEALPGSQLLLSAPSVQVDGVGEFYAFDSWDFGGGQNATYTVPGSASAIAMGSPSGWGTFTITARFVRAAGVLITANPAALHVRVDSRDNWPSPLFQWGVGTKHTIAAAPEQSDGKGRKYRFTGWSDGVTEPERELTVSQEMVDRGYHITAQYEKLGQLSVRSEPPTLLFDVSGMECRTPCNVDLPSGANVVVTPVLEQNLSPDTRLEFVGWTDGGEAVRNYTFTTDTKTVQARYRTEQKMTLISDPGAGAKFTTDPTTPDGYFVQGTRVSVTAEPNDGYKFKRWDGALAGTYPADSITMNSPATIVARMEKVPFVPPTGVRNAVGETPDKVVAPGSLIDVTGVNLMENFEAGPTNPLVQSIQGVTVAVGPRLLPLVYAGPDAIRAQLFSDVPEGEQRLTVKLPTGDPITASFTVARNAPGLFWQTDKDQKYAQATKENGTLVGPDNPARAGETITLWGTGFGPYRPGYPLDGFATPNNPPYPLSDTLEVVGADRSWPFLFAGAAGGQTGYAVVRLKIDPAMPSGGNLELRVKLNERLSNGVLIPIQAPAQE